MDIEAGDTLEAIGGVKIGDVEQDMTGWTCSIQVLDVDGVGLTNKRFITDMTTLDGLAQFDIKTNEAESDSIRDDINARGVTRRIAQVYYWSTEFIRPAPFYRKSAVVEVRAKRKP